MTDARNGKPPADLMALAEERFGSGGAVTDATLRAIAAFAVEYAAEQTEMLKRCDQDRVYRGKLLKKVRDTLYVIATDDEGDRVYFESSNDADLLSDLKATLEDWRWDDITREGSLPDLVENCREANERVEAARWALAEQAKALRGAERSRQDWQWRAEAAERNRPVLVKLAVAGEREACAKVADDEAAKSTFLSETSSEDLRPLFGAAAEAAIRIATAIRAREGGTV